MPRQPFLYEADRHHVHRSDRDSATRAGIGLRQSGTNVLRPEPFQFVVPVLGLWRSSAPARRLIGKTVICHARPVLLLNRPQCRVFSTAGSDNITSESEPDVSSYLRCSNA